MIKRTLYLGNPSYLSLRNAQLVLRLPEVSNNDTLPDTFKKAAERTIPIEDIGATDSAAKDCQSSCNFGEPGNCSQKYAGMGGRSP